MISLTRTIRWALLGGCLIAASPLAGQESSQANPSITSSNQLPPTSILPATSTWRFGLKITATSDTRGIQATVPVPMAWPDQKVTLLTIDKPDNVSMAKIREGTDSSQLFFSIRQLAAGEDVTVTADFQIEKFASEPPENPGQFQFDKRPKSSMRKFLTPSPFIESNDKTITDLAGSLPIDDHQSPWQQVEVIYDWVRDNVEYKFDPEIKSCLTALANRQGDCEELSSLFIALCRARGIPARAVWIPEHTYPEFFLLDANGQGHWFPCQAAGSRAFGYMPEAKPILQKGDKFKVQAEREESRYSKPVLKAQDAQSSPNVVWIMEPVVDEPARLNK
jgi:transglutaminase-like putative cysteine protease